jgi:hypothetical protein
MLTKRAERAAKEYSRRTAREDLCVARVSSGNEVRPGPYNLLPVVCSMHKGGSTSFLLLVAFLLRISDESHVGVLHWMMPFNPRTEGAVTRLLCCFGWDGRVWPEDTGWPGEKSQEAVGLRSLLKGQNILGTLTFPPDPDLGVNVVLRQEVLRTSANFPLSPDIPEGTETPEATPEMFVKLRKYAEDPESVFGRGLDTVQGV